MVIRQALGFLFLGGRTVRGLRLDFRLFRVLVMKP